jgi:hypothetical protein
MKKSTLSLLVAGVLAVAGAAQAQATFDSPVHQPGEASTMTHGQPNALTSNAPDIGTMGAGPAVVYTEGYTTYNVPVYVLPAPAGSRPYELDRGGASETSSVPGRAGEASTMTGGVPNMSTDNMPGNIHGPR